MEHISRTMLQHVRVLLDEEPAILVQGPRAAGKTTLLLDLAGGATDSLVDLADDGVLAVANQDPAGYLDGLAEPILVDEYQRLPAMLPVVKRIVDRGRRAGMFILTGSTTSSLLPRGTETLAGRSHDVTLWGFSQGELAGVVERFVDVAFDEPEALRGAPRPGEDRRGYVERVARGGFPEAVARQRESARRRWLVDYARRVAERDIPDLVRLQSPQSLRQVLRACAARTAQVTNITDMANDLSAGRDAVGRYVDLLERVFLVDRLPAFSRNPSSRLARHPKLHVTDSGLAAALQNLNTETLRRHVAFGPLLETFVVGEIRKQLGWANNEVELSHYRDHDGHEVDLLLERVDGVVVAVEVKAAVSIDRRDLGGLRHLADRLGTDFRHGMLLYTGPAAVQLGDDPRFSAIPIGSLWADFSGSAIEP